MWIRSQDRKCLLEVNGVLIKEYRNRSSKDEVRFIKGEITYNELNEDAITVWSINCDKGSLGIYSTEEKALKVLDTIHFYINDGCNVFKMPQDDEV